MVAADRLLTGDNAQHNAPAWAAAAIETANLMLMARGVTETSALCERVEAVAREHGDDYHAALARAILRGDDQADLWNWHRTSPANAVTATSKPR